MIGDIFPLRFGIFLILLSIIFVFWIWMLISAIRKPEEEVKHASKLVSCQLSSVG